MSDLFHGLRGIKYLRCVNTHKVKYLTYLRAARPNIELQAPFFLPFYG